MRKATRTRRRQMGEQGRPGRIIIQQDGGDDSTIFDLVRVFLVEGRFDGANEELLGVRREVGRALDQIAAGCIPTKIQGRAKIHPREVRSHATLGRSEQSQAGEEGGEECH